MKRTCVFLFIFIFSFCLAEGQEHELKIIVRTNPETMITGEPFTLTFIIDYAAPEQVNIISPPLPASLMLDRFIKFPRITESDTQTVAEYRLTANTAGRVSLDSFTIVTPHGIAETGAFALTIRTPGIERTLTARLVWEVPPRFTVGERAVITLRANNWNAQQPPPSFFMPAVPQNVILSSSPITAQERESGVALKMILIPLAPVNINFPARTLQHDNVRFEIPALNIRVIR